MSTLVAREFEAIESTGATVNDASARLRVLHTRQASAQKRRSEIEDSLVRLDGQLEADKLKDMRLVEATKAVSEKISGMVSALQYQDIRNQRIEHVTRGLGNIADQWQALEGNPGPEALYFLRDASRVESAQLEDVEGVFAGALGKPRTALKA
jgi:hypothetical protein